MLCITQRFLAYRETGVLQGERFDTRGMNTIQFVRKDGDWKMSALAWDDERSSGHSRALQHPTGKRHRWRVIWFELLRRK